MRIPSGKTDQLIFFVAVDSTDLKTRKTGLTSFTVYRSRNGGTATVYTTPTVAELSSSNMPGVYSLAIDEDTTIASGSDSEEYCVHITQASMAPVTRTIELYRRDTTSGRTLDVSAGGEAGLDWANVGSPTTTLALTGTTIASTQKVDVDTIKTNPVANGGTVTFPSNATLASTGNITAASGVSLAASQHVIVDSGTVTTVTNQLTTAQIATGVWTDTTAGDFTTSLSVGKSLMNGVALGTGLTVNALTTNNDKTGYALTSGYDPAKTAAQAGDIMKVSSGTGANQISLSSGLVTVGTNNDKTGYSLSQSFPTNFSSLAITAGGAVTAGTVSDKTGYALTSAYDPAKTASQAGDAMTLTAAYDAAKTAATQASVDDLPTNAELATSQAAADDATLSAIAALNNISTAQVNAEVDTALADVGLTTTITGRIDAAISSRMATFIYTAPANSDIAAIKAVTDGLPVFVHTGGKVWALDGDGNPLASAASVAALPTTSTVMPANIKKVNDIDVTGDGDVTPWGPA